MSEREDGPIAVPARVLEGIEEIRKSGVTNMLDRLKVTELLINMGYFDAADWVYKHRDEYAKAIFRGFKVEEISE
jgi:hypothetical protein